MILRFICLILWSLFILPNQLEAFALPPFITDEEAEMLFKILPLGHHQETTRLRRSGDNSSARSLLLQPGVTAPNNELASCSPCAC
mmetsp:Transcript_46609/g.84220  ORF Transcript_46609/g.84220 Transcript_46609/m.84220 type:complete len:86 (+) Transcript_46609:1-258(+)